MFKFSFGDSDPASKLKKEEGRERLPAKVLSSVLRPRTQTPWSLERLALDRPFHKPQIGPYSSFHTCEHDAFLSVSHTQPGIHCPHLSDAAVPQAALTYSPPREGLIFS